MVRIKTNDYDDEEEENRENVMMKRITETKELLGAINTKRSLDYALSTSQALEMGEASCLPL